MKKSVKQSVVIYVRHTSAEVRESHLQELQAYAFSAGLVVEQVFMDNGSANATSRSGLMALNEAVERWNIGTVLVTGNEALFRGKYLDTALFRQMLFGGVDLYTPAEHMRV
jgi:predicted site-specific integrase-resolvase